MVIVSAYTRECTPILAPPPELNQTRDHREETRILRIFEPPSLNWQRLQKRLVQSDADKGIPVI